jgi:predicted dehydrogenase
MNSRVFLPAAAVAVSLLTLGLLDLSAADLRVGIIGCDTSHATAFTETLNNPQAKGHVPGAKVVAAFRGGSPDLPQSWSRVEGYTKTLTEKYGVKFYDTIEEMCANVDAILLESVDGRPHLEQFKKVLVAQKLLPGTPGQSAVKSAANPLPVFVDKPMSDSQSGAEEIFRLAKETGTPVFSASSLRFGKTTQAVKGGSIGKVSYAETSSPCEIEPHHPDLVWYGIHGVESLFTVMGTGCEALERGTNSAGKIKVTGYWSGDRTGVYQEDKTYGGLARGETGEAPVGAFDGYAPLLEEIVKFYQTRVAPVRPEETLEIFAFMEAADTSKQQGGARVPLKRAK